MFYVEAISLIYDLELSYVGVPLTNKHTWSACLKPFPRHSVPRAMNVRKTFEPIATFRLKFRFSHQLTDVSLGESANGD